MSNFVKHGTLTTNVSTDSISLNGWATMTAHITGTGTITWQFKGADGEWRDIYGGSDNITLQAYTVSNMVNAFFADDVNVRGTVTGASGLTLDYQLMSNPLNRGT
jgi:hypothetical protein